MTSSSATLFKGRACLTGALVPLVAALCAASALAQPPDEAHARALARAKLDEGSALFRDGDYQGALEKFKQAYAAFPSPKIYFNLGQAYRGLARNVEALEAFESFLAEGPAAGAAPGPLAEARNLIAELKPKVSTVRVRGGAGAEVSVDGLSFGHVPLGRDIRLDPGLHQLVAQGGSGVPFVHKLTTVAGETVEVDIPVPEGVPDALHGPPPLVPAGASIAPAASIMGAGRAPGRKLPRRRWWVWGIAAAAAAGLAAVLLITRDGPLPDGSLGHDDLRTKK